VAVVEEEVYKAQHKEALGMQVVRAAAEVAEILLVALVVLEQPDKEITQVPVLLLGQMQEEAEVLVQLVRMEQQAQEQIKAEMVA
jgi:hypothetical protein